MSLLLRLVKVMFDISKVLSLGMVKQLPHILELLGNKTSFGTGFSNFPAPFTLHPDTSSTNLLHSALSGHRNQAHDCDKHPLPNDNV